jgi:UDP-glucose 4-epimerase
VVVLDDFSSGKRENLAQWSGDDRLEIVEVNIADGLFAPLAAITDRLGPVKRIVHLAAQVSVVRSVANPLDDLRINGGGMVQVLEYARCHRVEKVVFASSAAVYGDVAGLPVRESSEPRPVSPYGINKRSSELHLHYYAEVHGVPYTALRFFNVYGPRQDPSSPYSGVISIFADRAAAGEMITIFGDGEQTRDFIYVGDVSRTVATACLSDEGNGLVANLGTGKQTSINELARTIIDLCGSQAKLRYAEVRSGDIRHSVADIGRAQAVFGPDLATVGLADGLRETLAWAGQVNDATD